MKQTDDTDRYHRVLDYFTNDNGSGEFNTGSGKFYLESLSFKVCLQSRGTSSKDQKIYFWHIFEKCFHVPKTVSDVIAAVQQVCGVVVIFAQEEVFFVQERQKRQVARELQLKHTWYF